MTIWVSYFTFGEDIKMYKDTGLTTISFVCLLLALLTASSTVADEIEGKTAITLLSKPINRRQFIIGKFLGIELGVLALYVVLGALFAAGVWYKYAYDLREAAGGLAETAKQWAQVKQVLPGLVLGFFEVTVLTSISVAISTRLPMLVNLVVCILIFFLGHLSPVLVEAANAPNARDQRAGRLHGPALRLGPALARVLQRRPGDLDRRGHPLDWVRTAGIRLLHVVQWSGVVVRVPPVRGSRPGLTDRPDRPRPICAGIGRVPPVEDSGPSRGRGRS